MQVGLVAQQGNDRAAALAGALREALSAEGVTVRVDESTATALSIPGRPAAGFDAADLVVSVGGDGTFLFAAHHAETTPVLGVNLGEVGFLNAVAPGEAVETVTAAVERYRRRGSVRSRPLPRLVARGEDWRLEPALNEVTVQGRPRGPTGGLDVTVEVDGATYAEGRADGVLVATPTGSTAYNLSEGGPLVRPGLQAAVVTGMCQREPMPPLVTDLDSEVLVRVEGGVQPVVASDGRRRREVDAPATVRVGPADEPARLAGPGLDFFGALGKLE